MGYSQNEEVLLTYDKILQIMVDLDLRFTDKAMYQELRDRVSTSGFSKPVTDKVIDLINYVEEHGASDD